MTADRMWREYVSGYLKHNRASGVSVRIAAFISALLLSLLCGMFYNLWNYEIEAVKLREGGWHSRITAQADEAAVERLKRMPGIAEVTVQEAGEDAVSSRETGISQKVIDITFDDKRRVFSDTPNIVTEAGIVPMQITYHYELLALYLVRDSSDPAPRLLFPLFLFVTGLASFSLIVIIHNAFAVFANARIHQFGIFSSIGATPRQIRTCLLQEAAALCAVPVLLGNLLGSFAAAGVIQMSNQLVEPGTAGRHEAVFRYHPLVFALTLSVTVFTIWVSALLPAAALSRLTPLEAIRGTGELQLKRRKNSRILEFLFGVEGELAGNAVKAQKKALRTSSLSLIFSFLAFTIMQCFFATSDISTRETYFEQYQGVWDLMVTIKDAEIASFAETESVRGLCGVESAIVYQRTAAKRMITEEEMSEEFVKNGGFSHAAPEYVTRAEDGWLVNAPVVILDDDSFLAYCEQAGIASGTGGAVIYNQIRDVTNPDFRHPQYMPYLNADSVGETTEIMLSQNGGEGQTGETAQAAEIPVLGYTTEVPPLREEYATLDHYELVHFVPASLWRQTGGAAGTPEREVRICILVETDPAAQSVTAGQEEVTGQRDASGVKSESAAQSVKSRPQEDPAAQSVTAGLQEELRQLLARYDAVEIEDRVAEYEINGKMIWGMKAVTGFFCVLLAVIGIGNVFSNTLGFVRQRKREVVRYLSVGLTPKGIRKMFCIEALIVAGRPVLITLPVAVLAVYGMLRLSYLDAEEFFAEAPLRPIAVFLLFIAAAVVLAYYLGWRKIRSISLADVLKDDTMM